MSKPIRTVADVNKRVEGLRSLDSELAHQEEDEIRADVLAAIADGAATDSASALAAAALRSNEIDFSRWYA